MKKDGIGSRVDCIVVGGGVIGLASARELVQAGCEVLLLDRNGTGREASWAGAGLLSPLLPWHYPEPVTSLAAAGARCYPEWAACLRLKTGIDVEFLRSGMLVLSPFEEARARAWSDAHSCRVEQVDGADVVCGTDARKPALWLPDVAQVRNPRLMKALHTAFQQEGGVISENTPALGFVSAGRRVTAVATPEGERAAQVFVVCAGAWTGDLLGTLTPRPAIRPVRGQMLLYRGAPGLLSSIIFSDGTYLVPRRDGHILVGSTLEETGFDKSVTRQARARLAKSAHGLFPPLREARFVTQWAGLRPGSPGNVPLISRHPRLDNLYIHAGHFRYGVTMAPAAARLLADLITGRTPELDPQPYRWTDQKLDSF